MSELYDSPFTCANDDKQSVFADYPSQLFSFPINFCLKSTIVGIIVGPVVTVWGVTEIPS